MDSDTSLKCLTEEERKVLFEEFLEEVEHRLRKEERHTWMVKDPDHLHQNDK